MSVILLGLLASPLVAALLMAIIPAKSKGVFEVLHILSIIAVLGFGIAAIASNLQGQTLTALGDWFVLDKLGVIFVGLISVVGFLTGVFSLPYVSHDYEEGKLDVGKVKLYYALYSVFLFTMILAATTNNVILMWVAVEATTLATAFLVGIYSNKKSLEAAWKYVIVCTCGVAFGLYGTVLFYADAANVLADPHTAVFWSSILENAKSLDPRLTQIAFVFIAVGFGTKAGLFPMHTWLPDAHAEAPSPVSALLSGVLLKCAALVIIRFYTLSSVAIGPEFPQLVMLILGVTSVVVAALFFFAQDDFKRKLAYSSTENIGIVAICLGFGGPIGIFAALFHCVAHALTKGLLFCISGNLLMRYNTRDLKKIQGIAQMMPLTATIMVLALFALAGFPPLALFWSEINMIIAGIQGGYLLLVILILAALTIVIAGVARILNNSVLKDRSEEEPHDKKELGALVLIPEAIMIALVLWIGICMPAPLTNAIQEGSAIVLQEDISNLELFSNNFDTQVVQK